MNGDDIFLFSVLGCLLIVGVGVAGLFVDSLFNSPIAAQEATEICWDKGYDRYEKFGRVPFTTKVNGVQCVYSSRYDLEEGMALVKVG